jgi:hypothetical protein
MSIHFGDTILWVNGIPYPFAEVLSAVEQHVLLGAPDVMPPREGGLMGKSVEFVIVDEIYSFKNMRAALLDDVRECIRVEVAKITKQKGPPKRTGGKFRSKWDRWG